MSVTWNGSEQEYRELEAAVAHNCGCEFAEAMLTKRCGAHEALNTSQRFLDGMLCGRYFKEELLEEEFAP